MNHSRLHSLDSTFCWKGRSSMTIRFLFDAIRSQTIVLQATGEYRSKRIPTILKALADGCMKSFALAISYE